MPCSDCASIQIELGSLKEFIRGWFSMVIGKMDSLESGQQFCFTRFDQQDQVLQKLLTVAEKGNITSVEAEHEDRPKSIQPMELPQSREKAVPAASDSPITSVMCSLDVEAEAANTVNIKQDIEDEPAEIVFESIKSADRLGTNQDVSNASDITTIISGNFLQSPAYLSSNSESFSLANRLQVQQNYQQKSPSRRQNLADFHNDRTFPATTAAQLDLETSETNESVPSSSMAYRRNYGYNSRNLMQDSEANKSVFSGLETKRLMQLVSERKHMLGGRLATRHHVEQSIRRAAWCEITDILNREGGNFTLKQVKKRWQNVKFQKNGYLTSHTTVRKRADYQ